MILLKLDEEEFKMLTNNIRCLYWNEIKEPSKNYCAKYCYNCNIKSKTFEEWIKSKIVERTDVNECN